MIENISQFLSLNARWGISGLNTTILGLEQGVQGGGLNARWGISGLNTKKEKYIVV